MQGQIHSALLWPPEVSIFWNRVVEGDVTRQSRARSRRESHEILEMLRRTGWGWRTNWPVPTYRSAPYVDTSLPDKTVHAVVAARGEGVVASCPVCGEPKTGRKASACAERCRAAKDRRKRVDASASEEDPLILALTRGRTLRGTQAEA